MALLISLLGPLAIESEGRRLGKVPKKARALLAYLATEGSRPISRERLADLLWPYQGSDQARHSLRNCLVELRKALGESNGRHLAAEFASCRLQDVDVDVERFERLARSSTRSELFAAAELYRGEFLADFAIDSEPFQEWLAAERDRTLDLVCGVLQRLTALQDQAGEHDAAIQSARRLAGLELAVGDRSARADPRLCPCRKAARSAAAVPHLRRDLKARTGGRPRRGNPGARPRDNSFGHSRRKRRHRPHRSVAASRRRRIADRARPSIRQARNPPSSRTRRQTARAAMALCIADCFSGCRAGTQPDR